MKHKSRQEKLAVLQAAINGDISALREYKRGILEPITSMVVCSNGKPGPGDLVEVTVRHNNEKQIVTYGEFLKRVDYYHPMCITVDA